ncbi:hypothetical protein C3B60_02200 [Cryobacterium zongtaii]|nr:hypothetical protein C3B60_02200 [Cryobacterium zongtaii]
MENESCLSIEGDAVGIACSQWIAELLGNPSHQMNETVDGRFCCAATSYWRVDLFRMHGLLLERAVRV